MRFEEATDPLSRLRLAIVTHAQVYNSTDVDEDFVVPETWPRLYEVWSWALPSRPLRRLEASANLDRRKRRPLTHKYSGEELRRDASSRDRQKRAGAASSRRSVSSGILRIVW